MIHYFIARQCTERCLRSVLGIGSSRYIYIWQRTYGGNSTRLRIHGSKLYILKKLRYVASSPRGSGDPPKGTGEPPKGAGEPQNFEKSKTDFRQDPPGPPNMLQFLKILNIINNFVSFTTFKFD